MHLGVTSDTNTKLQILTQKLVQRHESTDADAEARHASGRVTLTVAAVALTVAAVAGGASVWQQATCGCHVGRRLHAGVIILSLLALLAQTYKY